MPTAIIVILAVVVVILLIGIIYFFSTYNSLVTLRNKVRNQKSQIDVELKRRFDLIPNLVETVKGYVNHEKTTLESVIAARNSYVAAPGNTAQALDADGALTGALSKLFALSESYPDLKANANFVNLQNQLSETEKRIVYSRQFYNDAVYKLNNKIEMFPSSIVAGMFSFSEESFFEAKEEEKENVKVSF